MAVVLRSVIALVIRLISTGEVPISSELEAQSEKIFFLCFCAFSMANIHPPFFSLPPDNFFPLNVGYFYGNEEFDLLIHSPVHP